MKSIGNVLYPCALAILMLLCGCAGSKISALLPMEQKLTSFKTVYFTAEPLVAEDISQELADLEERFVAQLNKKQLFDQVLLAGCTADCDSALIVKAVVTDINKVSGTSRFLAGAFAGNATMTAEVTFIDGGSGRQIGAYTVTGESGSSGWSGGTESAVAKIADAIVKLIAEHF